ESLDKTVRNLSSCPVFMVGFNRRFAPTTEKLSEALAGRPGPLMATYRVNAGALPPDHWANTAEGGGRLRGEACHMIDFFQAIVRSPLKSAVGRAIHAPGGARPDENFSAEFEFDDGSLGTLIYTSLGHADVSKEWLEVHWD